jgi:hypothetical protein
MVSSGYMLRSCLSAQWLHHSMVMASTPVRGLILLISRRITFDFSIIVPCNFDTPISVYVGGKEVKISPASFNLGPVSAGSSTCYGGAAYDSSLTGMLASDNLLGDAADLVQDFGFSVTFSCGTLTLLGTLVRVASASPILFESWKLSTLSFSSVTWTFFMYASIQSH